MMHTIELFHEFLIFRFPLRDFFLKKAVLYAHDSLIQWQQVGG